MNRIGHTLYLWRLAKGWSQDELARRMNFPRPNLSNIEKGKQDITLSTLELFARVFETTAGTLADGKRPGDSVGGSKMGRESLERIARAVLSQKVKLGDRERTISVLLSRLLQNRRDALSGTFRKHRYASRLENESWLKLQTLLSSEEIKSLIERVLGALAGHESTPN